MCPRQRHAHVGGAVVVAHVVKHTDATDIPVCLNKNATRNKMMGDRATWGHSGKGFYFGLKLTMCRDVEGRLLSFVLSSPGSNDRALFKKAAGGHCHVIGLVGGDLRP